MSLSLGAGLTVQVTPPAVPVVTAALPSTGIVVVPVAGPPGMTGSAGAPGPPGLSGPTGPAGDFFIYVQAAPAATWIAVHNLGRLVHATIFDASNGIAYADVDQGSPNQTTITFAVPTVGSVVFS